MLEVQKYLKSGKTHQHLTDELGIVVLHHDTLPLTILNYDQIESPKLHPIVAECRGLVLHRETHDVVAKSMNRFFNWSEVPNAPFNFKNCNVLSKEDGSLVLLYKFNGAWHANTRGSFGHWQIRYTPYTWHGLICEAAGIKNLQDFDDHLDDRYTYVCELVSPYNKVVRYYPQPQLYLLTQFEGINEKPVEDVPSIFKRPSKYDFHSIDEISAFLDQQAKDDPTFEGVVICDDHFRRYKVKSVTYWALHQLRDNGNIFNPRKLVPYILKGDWEELISYFPEVKPAVELYKARLDEAYANLVEVWEKYWRIADQKEFALAIQGKTRFTGLLFDLRKKSKDNQTKHDLLHLWANAAPMILKVLFRAPEIEMEMVRQKSGIGEG